MADKRFPIDYQQKTDPMVEDDVVMLSDSEDLGKIKRVKQSQFKWDTGAKITSATISGDDIVFSLDDSSTATLIDGAKDLKGKDWDEVELRVDSNNIEWKLSQDIARTVLTPLSAIKGDTWAKIVWADWDWNNMKFTLDDSSTVSLVNAKIDLKGDKWEPWDTGSPWAPWNDWADWKEVELQTTPTHIQWKYDTDISRNNLVLLSDLKGADGSDGSDGREIQLQTNATHIQWKYDTDVVWNDLIALSTLKGDKWDDGAKINWVSWDNNDMKFTLDDSSTVSLVNAKTDLKGDTGSTWPVGMQWKWVWIAWSYDKNDWVSYQGSSYIANKNTSQTPWGSDWDILAQQWQAGAGSGDMLASVYDPTNKAVDAFDFDNFYNTPTAISEANIKNASHTTGGLITGQRAEQLMANEATKARTISNKKLGNDLDANSKKITNLATPTNNADAATKKYVDDNAGDMLASTYDPNNIADDAFSMDNMVEWTTNKHFTATIATRLADTSWINTWDEDTTSIKTKLWAASTSTDWYLTSTDWNTFNAKQAALVSGTNIKTVWGNSLLWSGNIPLSGGAWWTITGTLSAQTDLQTALDGKAEKPMRIITKTSSYTLVLADVNGDTLLRMNSASDTTVTIPTNASVASPVGIELLIENIGTGKVTIAWAGWVTVGGDLVLENQNDTRGLVQTSANTWKSYGGGSVVPWENNIGYLNIPQVSKSANYTLVLWDAWKSIDHPSSDANARTFTIPSNASVAYPVGTTISFSNMSSQDVTIAITTDTMYLAWDGTTGSRTLAQYGVATVRKLTATTRLISWIWLT